MLDLVKSRIRKYEVKHLGYFISLLENLKLKVNILEDEINFYIKTLKSLNFNQTYELPFPNLALSEPTAQIFDKVIEIGKFSYSICFSIENALQVISNNHLIPYPCEIKNADISRDYINDEKLMYADLTEPIISIYFTPNSKPYIIDGIHRVAKAQRLGYEMLPGYVLYPNEFLQCVINKEIIKLYKIHHNYSMLIKAFDTNYENEINLTLYSLHTNPFEIEKFNHTIEKFNKVLHVKN